MATRLTVNDDGKVVARTIVKNPSHRKSKAQRNALDVALTTTVATSEDLSALKAMDIIAFASVAEARFVTLTTAYIRDEGTQTVNAILAEAAYELDVSIETAKRYLLKHTARRAEFVITSGKVGLR